jgi:hypothetical protein
MQVPISPDVSPQKFQDDLRAAVNLITEKAAAAGVELPKGFYLGFAHYANGLPNERAAPVLARQLGIINKIVTDLVDFRVKSIDALERLALPEESSAVPPAAQPSEKILPRQGTEGLGVNRQPLDLAFTAEQGKLRVAFNSLLGSDQFLLVRNLMLENTSRVGPPISRGGTSNSATVANQPAGSSAESSAASNNLNVILGRELVKASLRLEIINFPANGQPTKN